MLSLDPHHHHRKSVKDAAEMREQAVAKTITKETADADAKDAHGLSLKIQVARTLIAVAFTQGGLRTIQTGVWLALAPSGRRALLSPSVLALYAPAVVGAFRDVNSRHQGFVLHPQVPVGSIGS